MSTDWQSTLLRHIQIRGVDTVMDAICATNERRRALTTLSGRQRAVLRKHGYPWWALPLGVTGEPGYLMLTLPTPMMPHGMYARHRVCQLDGVEIDGCEYSDLDCDGVCIHCGTHISVADTWPTE